MLWPLVGSVSRVLRRYGLLEFVSMFPPPKKGGVREGRTRTKGEGREQKGGEGKYVQKGISSVHGEGKGSFKEFACNF